MTVLRKRARLLRGRLAKVVRPGPTESRDEFIDRCMDAESGAFPDRGQRFAVCNQKWRDRED